MKCLWRACHNLVIPEKSKTGITRKFCSPNCKSAHNVVEHRKKSKDRAIAYKGGKCNICGYNRCARALVFHHADPNTKDFGVTGFSVSWETTKTELDKCVLLCANCHAEVHEGVRILGTR